MKLAFAEYLLCIKLICSKSHSEDNFYLHLLCSLLSHTKLHIVLETNRSLKLHYLFCLYSLSSLLAVSKLPLLLCLCSLLLLILLCVSESHTACSFIVLFSYYLTILLVALFNTKTHFALPSVCCTFMLQYFALHLSICYSYAHY